MYQTCIFYVKTPSNIICELFIFGIKLNLVDSGYNLKLDRRILKVVMKVTEHFTQHTICTYLLIADTIRLDE